MSNENNEHEDDFNNSWMEVFALRIGTDNILDFLERIKPEFDDINRLAEIEMSLISLKQMRGYFKRKADEIDNILDNHPAWGNSIRVGDKEEYPHSHSTADWKPDLDLVTNISDMVHGKSNIIPFRYKDKNN